MGTRSLRIGSRLIGGAEPPYVIAEAGVCHDGEPAMAHALIDAAKSAGADAVKFQMFSAERLAAADAPAAEYQKAHDQRGESQREMLRRLELSAECFADLKRHADAARIDFLATPFGLPELDALLRLEPPAIKIASPDLLNVPLLTAAAESGLPLIVSTGASDLSEVDRAVERIEALGGRDRLILMHCVSAYPTPMRGARLRCIEILANRFDVAVGYSDHTKETFTAALAVAAGACVLEKHITLDCEAEGPDHFFSLEPEQFREYVRSARNAHEALGGVSFQYGVSELDVRSLSRGSLIVAKQIREGQRLSATDLGVQRPGDGMGPEHWDEVVGSVATTDIAAGTRLSWAMIEQPTSLGRELLHPAAR